VGLYLSADQAEQEAGVAGQVKLHANWQLLLLEAPEEGICVDPCGRIRPGSRDSLDYWREKRQRERQWLTPEQAASLVEEPELVTLIEGFTPA
jgi:hypothetical protein